MKKIWIAVLVLVLCLTAFAACKRTKTATPLDSVSEKTVTYDGSTLKWGAVSHADAYEVTIDDGKEELTKTVQENFLSIDRSADVTFKILAISNGGSYSNAETKAQVKFTYLPMVSEITILDRADEVSSYHFSWNPSAGADYYLLKENDQADPVKYQPKEGETVLKQPVGTADSGRGGKASLSVLPCSSTDDHTYSHWSAKKEVTVLAAPSGFTYNLEKGIIAWSSAEDVVYKVFLGEDPSKDSAVVNEWELASEAHYVYKQETSDSRFVFSVKAYSATGDKNVLSSRIASRSFVKLDPISGLKCEFGEIRWDASTITNKYQVRITKSGDASSVLLSYDAHLGNVLQDDLEALVPEGDIINLDVVVRPVIASSEAEDLVTYADWSRPLSIGFLRAPKLEYRGNNQFGWNTVSGPVGSYRVFIEYNGTKILEDDVTKSALPVYRYDFTNRAGTYTVTVAALPNGAAEDSANGASAKSAPLNLVVLGAPEQFSVLTEKYNVQYGVTLDELPTEQGGGDAKILFNDIYGADTYILAQSDRYATTDTNGDGIPDQKEDNQTDVTQLTIRTEDYRIGEDGKKYFTIDTLGGDATGFSKTCYLLAQSKLSDHYVVLDENTQRFVAVPEGETSNTVVLNGNDARPIVITKLASPTGVVLTGDQLKWSKVSMASGYIVRIVCTSDKTIEPQYQMVYGDYYNIGIAKEGAYDIYVCALGNGNSILTSIYSDPIHVVKLPAVTNLQVTTNAAGVTTLNWAHQAFRYNNEDYYPKGYQVQIGTYTVTLNEVNKNENASYTLSDKLEQFNTSGTTCAVKALGLSVTDISDNKVHLLDAKVSSSVTIFRLERPGGLTASANMLAWAMVPQAQAYEVYNGGNLLGTVTGTTFVFDRAKLAMDDPADPGYFGGKSLEFTVRAIRNENQYKRTDLENSYYMASEKSVMYAVTKLPTPQVTVEMNTGVMSWGQLSSASSYLVKVGVEGDQNPYSYLVANDESVITHKPTIIAPDGTTLQVSVTAIGDGVSYIDSFPFTYKTTVKKLDALKKTDNKTFGIKVNNDLEGKAESFTVSVLDKDILGRGYNINIGGVDVFTADGEYTVTTLAAGEYKVKVCAVGGNYTGEIKDQGDGNTYYINSDYSETQTFYVLAAPTNDNVYVSTGGRGVVTERVVSFKAVSAAAGYRIKYTYRKLVEPAALTDDAKYDALEGDYPCTVTFDVGHEVENVAYIEDGKVCFVLTGVTGEVDNIQITVTVLGDGINAITSESSTVSYDVR